MQLERHFGVVGSKRQLFFPVLVRRLLGRGGVGGTSWEVGSTYSRNVGIPEPGGFERWSWFSSPSFSRAPGVSGWLSFVPQSSHMDGALSKLLSFTASGEWVACGSVPMFLCSQCPPRPHTPWPFPAGLTGALRVCLWSRCGRGPGFGHTGLKATRTSVCRNGDPDHGPKLELC